MSSLIFPKLNNKVEIESAVDDHCVVFNPMNNKYLRIGVREVAFLKSLSGTSSKTDLAISNKQSFNQEQVDLLLGWFGEQGLLEGIDPLKGVKSEPMSLPRKFVYFLKSPGNWRYTLFNPDKILNKNKELIDRLFSKGALLIYVLLLSLPAIVFILTPQKMINSFTDLSMKFSWQEWLVLYFSLFITIAFHEIAHAVTCKHYGGKVQKIAVKLMYFNPVVFCDVSDSWRFTEAKQKIVVASAGIFFQLLVSAICTVVVVYNPSSLLVLYIYVNTFIALFNLFPLIRLDGYWILSHAINEPNLIMQGKNEVDKMIRQFLMLSVGSQSKPEKIKASLLSFGVAHLVTVPLFLMVGISAIYRYVSKLDLYLAYIVLVILSGPVIYGFIKSTFRYCISLYKDKSIWKSYE